MSQTNICICVMCGLPGSGKSTLCKILQKCNEFSFIHVSYDDLIPWIDFTKPDVIETWKTHRNKALQLVEHFIDGIISQNMQDVPLDDLGLLLKDHVANLSFKVNDLIKEGTSNPIIFIIDDNMPYRRMRYEYCQIARKFQVGFCIIKTDCPFVTCKIRNQNRPLDKIVQKHSLMRINARMENPDPEKASWEENSLIIDTSEAVSDTEITRCIDLLKHALLNPCKITEVADPKLAEESRAVNISNIKHQTDLCLRKISSDCLKKASDPRLLAPRLTLAKRWILNSMKYGDMDERECVTEAGAIDQVALRLKMEDLFDAFMTSLDQDKNDEAS